MELMNEKVYHKVFKNGTVIEFTGTYIIVKFDVKPVGKDTDTIKFLYPSAFDGFLTANNKFIQNEILADISARKEAEQKEREERQHFRMSYTITKQQAKKKEKKYKRENIVFKCNYCNGGATERQIGFAGVCSKDMIDYNINTAGRSWCSYKDCKCRKYLDSSLTYDEICEEYESGEFLCYESKLLTDWQAYAGTDTNGENRGRHRKLNKVQKNSLCVLTTVEPNTPEETRFVFGVFLVDETHEGDEHEAGYVTTKSTYKLKLSSEEAHQILLWNYHKNPNDEDRAFWGSGLYRYITDTVSAQILKDIAIIKKGTTDEDLAKEFLEYYCQVNNVDLKTLPEPDGALKL